MLTHDEARDALDMLAGAIDGDELPTKYTDRAIAILRALVDERGRAVEIELFDGCVMTDGFDGEQAKGLFIPQPPEEPDRAELLRGYGQKGNLSGDLLLQSDHESMEDKIASDIEGMDIPPVDGE